MNDILYMIIAFFAGMVMGTLFFLGLWITVKKAVNSKIPALWLVGSFFLRIGIILIGFYFISLGNWQRLLVCVLGFIVARFIVLNLTKSNEQKQLKLKNGSSYDT